jgi:fumarate reductase flavoprotein subunit
MQAVYNDGSKYEIDRDQCVECGLCEMLCPTFSIYDEDDNSKPASHEKIIRECEMVVCGGGSGLVAAIKAGQLGKKVILLEKAKRVGGNMCLAHSFFPVYSKLHAELGLDDVRERIVTELSGCTDGMIGSDIMRTAVYGCSEFTDWLLEFPGTRNRFSLELSGEKRAMARPVSGPAVLRFPKRIENRLSKDASIGPGFMGSFVKKIMLEAIPAQKLDVEILLEHEARHLITEGAGRVTGVIARDPGGETEIRCKAVILATGGYGASDAKLQKYFGFFDVERPLHRFTVPGNTGDAIDMLQELGTLPDPERMFVSTLGPAHRPFSYSLCRVLEHPAALLVNLDGKRWMDESIGITGGAERVKGSPREVAWGIYTQQNIDDIMQGYLSDKSPADDCECLTYYQEDLDREAGYRKPPVHKADTIDELAEKLDVDPGVLKKTVVDYNRFCRNGNDDEFNKSAEYLVPREHGPYYAIYGQLFSECAAGGLTVDAKCHVLHNDNSPIPGLYAGGDATSAMHRRGEPAVVSELTWALASAYRCAVESVKEMECSL